MGRCQCHVGRPASEIGAVATNPLSQPSGLGRPNDTLYGVLGGLHGSHGAPSCREIEGRAFTLRTGHQHMPITRVGQGADQHRIGVDAPVLRLLILFEHFETPRQDRVRLETCLL